MELSGYNKILVDSFLNRPNVKRDDNTISFYQLYCEIRNYFNECYSKAYYNEKLVIIFLVIRTLVLKILVLAY